MSNHSRPLQSYVHPMSPIQSDPFRFRDDNQLTSTTFESASMYSSSLEPSMCEGCKLLEARVAVLEKALSGKGRCKISEKDELSAENVSALVPEVVCDDGIKFRVNSEILEKVTKYAPDHVVIARKLSSILFLKSERVGSNCRGVKGKKMLFFDFHLLQPLRWIPFGRTV